MIIKLTQGYEAIIDDEYANQSLHKWYAAKFKQSCVYAVRHDPKNHDRLIKLHREIIGAKVGEITDHVNGDTLDNRRSNLRVCTVKDNSRNRGLQKNNRSGFKGIYRTVNGNYRAQIHVNKKRIVLGHFKTAVAASRAYNIAAKKYFGEFARIEPSY